MTSRQHTHSTVTWPLVRNRRFFRASRGLTPRVRRVASLSAAEREAMWLLYAAAYDGARREDFQRDLREKQHVVVLKDDGKRLQGFSTLLVLETAGACVVFSGDTIVAPGFWGQTALQRAFIWYLMAQRLKRPGTPVFWFLITKGYRTYLLLSRYFPNHFPRHDAATPPDVSALLDTLCREKFGEAWRPETGTLRFAGESARLAQALADVPERLKADPDVAFFLARNPRWAEGEELCCLARADDAFVEKTTRIFL
ncbi:MAG: hypothetical protein AB1938_12890 [Myxococcota bacterium]